MPVPEARKSGFRGLAVIPASYWFDAKFGVCLIDQETIWASFCRPGA
jgi:hypothetical protein